jgi:hypothetical protein
MEERNSPHCIETQINIYIFWGGEKFTILYRNTNKNHKSPFIKPWGPILIGLNLERISNKGENLCKIAIIIFRFCDIFDFKCVTSTGLLPTGREIDVQINRSLNWIPNFSLQISFKLYWPNRIV